MAMLLLSRTSHLGVLATPRTQGGPQSDAWALWCQVVREPLVGLVWGRTPGIGDASDLHETRSHKGGDMRLA